LHLKYFESESNYATLSNRLKTPPIKTRLFKTIIKGISESGREIPNKKPNSLIKRLASIRNATLSPTEKRTVSAQPNSSNLSSLRITNPGRKVK
jgi:hypothetical protein